MTDPERRHDRDDGDAPLAFEGGRRSRSRGPAPVTLIASLCLLLVVGGGVFYMYRSGARGANDAPQPLGAPLGDVRAPAPAQAQTPDPSAGLTISKDDPNALTAQPTLAPPPEQPQSETVVPAQPPQPSQASAGGATPGTVAPVNAPAPKPPPPKVVPSKQAEDRPDPIDGILSKPAKPKVLADAGGSAVVQIGAFSSEALADREWSKAASVAPGAMAGRGKRVVPVEKDGQTLYRTSITGFASHDQAVALCDRLKAAGGSCFVR